MSECVNKNLVAGKLVGHKRILTLYKKPLKKILTITSRLNSLGLPKPTFQRIMSIDLTWHLYRMQKRHKLKVGDYARRMAFSEWLLERNGDNHFLRNLIIGDDAGF